MALGQQYEEEEPLDEITHWSTLELLRRKKAARTTSQIEKVKADIRQWDTDPVFRKELAEIGQHGRLQTPGAQRAAIIAGAASVPLSLVPGMAIPVGAAWGAFGGANLIEAFQRQRAGLPWKGQAGLGALDVALAPVGAKGAQTLGGKIFRSLRKTPDVPVPPEEAVSGLAQGERISVNVVDPPTPPQSSTPGVTVTDPVDPVVRGTPDGASGLQQGQRVTVEPDAAPVQLTLGATPTPTRRTLSRDLREQERLQQERRPYQGRRPVYLRPGEQTAAQTEAARVAARGTSEAAEATQAARANVGDLLDDTPDPRMVEDEARAIADDVSLTDPDGAEVINATIDGALEEQAIARSLGADVFEGAEVAARRLDHPDQIPVLHFSDDADHVISRAGQHPVTGDPLEAVTQQDLVNDIVGISARLAHVLGRYDASWVRRSGLYQDIVDVAQAEKSRRTGSESAIRMNPARMNEVIREWLTTGKSPTRGDAQYVTLGVREYSKRRLSGTAIRHPILEGTGFDMPGTSWGGSQGIPSNALEAYGDDLTIQAQDYLQRVRPGPGTDPASIPWVIVQASNLAREKAHIPLQATLHGFTIPILNAIHAADSAVLDALQQGDAASFSRLINESMRRVPVDTESSLRTPSPLGKVFGEIGTGARTQGLRIAGEFDALPVNLETGMPEIWHQATTSQRLMLKDMWKGMKLTGEDIAGEIQAVGYIKQNANRWGLLPEGHVGDATDSQVREIWNRLTSEQRQMASLLTAGSMRMESVIELARRTFGLPTTMPYAARSTAQQEGGSLLGLGEVPYTLGRDVSQLHRPRSRQVRGETIPVPPEQRTWHTDIRGMGAAYLRHALTEEKSEMTSRGLIRIIESMNFSTSQLMMLLGVIGGASHFGQTGAPQEGVPFAAAG